MNKLEVGVSLVPQKGFQALHVRHLVVAVEYLPDRESSKLVQEGLPETT